jgi:long-chain acyl-CoA synthetase
VHKTRASIFPGVPTLYTAINNHPDVKKFDLSSVKICLSGSAPLPQEVQQRFEVLTGGKLVEGYGLSETSPVAHAGPIQGFRKAGSIGLPLPDTDARIVDLETKQPLATGEVGELAIRGPQVMKGYWQRPEETAEALRDGWFFTGDIGRMDEDGFFYIVDRAKDMIAASGLKVLPRDVEEVLFTHPAVLEAVVAGVPDPYRGETVKAWIVLKPGATATADAITAHCKQGLAAFKVPKLIEFRTELPKTAVGKVLRRVLVEEEKKKEGA